MTTSVTAMSPDVPLIDVATTMHESRVSCIVVVEGKRPVAVVSERDMTRLVSEILNGNAQPTLRDVMSPGIITLHVQASCQEAVELAHSHCIRRMVIVDDAGELAGVVTQTDLLKAHAEDIEQQKDKLELAVTERTIELHEANKRLMTLTRVDPLLGVGNRRSMDEELIKIAERARRYQRPFSIALLDVDNFKAFNDYYGHQLGDNALVRIATTLRSAVRVADTVYRYGGEEFLVLLPEVGISGAATAAEHMREAVESLAINHQLAEPGVVTVSVGVAEENILEPKLNTLIKRADNALYAAKAGGRNRIEMCRADDDGDIAA